MFYNNQYFFSLKYGLYFLKRIFLILQLCVFRQQRHIIRMMGCLYDFLCSLDFLWQPGVCMVVILTDVFCDTKIRAPMDACYTQLPKVLWGSLLSLRL